ncbi:hypothetical protein ACJX0J_027124 [Zea mays]
MFFTDSDAGMTHAAEEDTPVMPGRTLEVAVICFDISCILTSICLQSLQDGFCDYASGDIQFVDDATAVTCETGMTYLACTAGVVGEMNSCGLLMYTPETKGNGGCCMGLCRAEKQTGRMEADSESSIYYKATYNNLSSVYETKMKLSTTNKVHMNIIFQALGTGVILHELIILFLFLSIFLLSGGYSTKDLDIERPRRMNLNLFVRGTSIDSENLLDIRKCLCFSS